MLSGCLAGNGRRPKAVVGELLAVGKAEVVIFDAPGDARDHRFVPDECIALTVADVELSTLELERLRRATFLKDPQWIGRSSACVAMR